MKSLHIPEVLHRIAEDVLVLAWGAAGCPPPEPGAVILMERTENQRHISCLQLAVKLSHHIKICPVHLVQVSPRQDALHHAPLQIVRGIAAEIVLAIYLWPLCHLGKIRQMHGHGEDCPFLGSRNINPCQLLRKSHPSCLLIVCQCQLIAGQCQGIQPHHRSMVAYHILRIRCPRQILGYLLVQLVLMAVEHLVTLGDALEVGKQLCCLRGCLGIRQGRPAWQGQLPQLYLVLLLGSHLGIHIAIRHLFRGQLQLPHIQIALVVSAGAHDAQAQIADTGISRCKIHLYRQALHAVAGILGLADVQVRAGIDNLPLIGSLGIQLQLEAPLRHGCRIKVQIK